MISVIIPAYNEEFTLPGAIVPICEQLQHDPQSEIILVISGCTDSTLNVAQNIQKKYGNIRILIQNKREGKASALLLARKIIRGDVTILTDADVIWDDNALDYLMKNFNKSNVGLVCARVEALRNGKRLIDIVNKIHCEIWHRSRLKDSINNSLSMPSGYLYAIRTQLLPEIPLETINDDYFIGLHVVKKGFGCLYEPQSIVKVCFPANYHDYFQQKIRTQTGRIQLLKYNQREVSKSMKFFFKESVSHVLRKTGNSRKAAIVHLLLLLLCRAPARFIYMFSDIKAFSIWKPVNSTKPNSISNNPKVNDR